VALVEVARRESRSSDWGDLRSLDTLTSTLRANRSRSKDPHSHGSSGYVTENRISSCGCRLFQSPSWRTRTPYPAMVRIYYTDIIVNCLGNIRSASDRRRSHFVHPRQYFRLSRPSPAIFPEINAPAKLRHMAGKSRTSQIGTSSR
jgi:hypothetical protein